MSRLLFRAPMVALTCVLVSATAHAQRTKRPSPVRDSLTTSRVIIQLTPGLAASLDSLAKSAAIAVRSNEAAEAGVLTTITRVLGVATALLGIVTGVLAFFKKKQPAKVALAVVVILLLLFLLLGAAVLVGALMLPLGVLLLAMSVLLLSLAAWGFLLIEIDQRYLKRTQSPEGTISRSPG
jgi:uncharacterized membrane protein